MKVGLLSVVILLLLFGCGSPAPTATRPVPTVAPIALAQTTNAPTPTRDPNAPVSKQTTRAATSAPTATTAPSATPAPTQTHAPAGPAVIAQFPLLELPGEGRGPDALALVEGGWVYVANQTSGNVGVIDTDHVIMFYLPDKNPSALAVNPATKTLYVAGGETPTLYQTVTGKIVQQVATGGRVNALTIDDDLIYVALDNDAKIERYDIRTLAKRDELTLSQGFGVSDVVVDKPRNRLYAAIYGKIVAIDLATFQELHTVDVPYLYAGIAVNPLDGSVWAGGYDDEFSRAFVIGYSAEGKELARTFLGGDLVAATFDDTGKLYVLDRSNNQVHVIQAPQGLPVTTIAVNEFPADAAFDATRKQVWISNEDSDNVTVVDTTDHSIVSTVPLANNITALATNPTRNRVYAVNASSNTVYVIEGTRIVGQASTGNHPIDLAVDPALNRLYVANRADGTLQIIDENTLEITASEFITRSLSTVELDTVNGKLFAASTLLNPETLERESVFFAQGLTLGSQTTPQYELADSALKKLYAIASNGVPGSNSRVTLYRFLYDDLTQSKLLGSRNGGNTSALAIDPTTNQLYATNTHPLAYTHGLDVFDAGETIVQSLSLASHTTALVVNPSTNHLFLSHAQTYQPYATQMEPRDNTVEILDTRTLGQVATLDVPNDPWRMALLGDTVYVASYRDGQITLIRDGATEQPAAPTPTLTASPYPTWTFTPAAVATGTPVPQSTVVTSGAACPIEMDGAVQAKADSVGRERLGCPVGVAVTSDRFAVQPLETRPAIMFDDFRDESAKVVTVLFPDKSFREYPDTWDGLVDAQCLDVNVKPGIWRPKRGFGSVWCFQPEVQALGGGLVEERGVTVTLQEFENGKIWAVPDVGVFVLFKDGKWE